MLNSEFVHCMRTSFNPFMQSGISHPYQLKQSTSVLRDVKWYFSFLFNFNRKLCKQTVETLIRHRVRLGRLSGSALFAYVPEKGARHIWVKMQLFCRNLGSILLKQSS